MASLKKGDRGAGVLLLQGMLHRLNYNITGVDGVFGGETLDAVKAFQDSMGVETDGIVGENTANMMVSEMWAIGMGEEDHSEDAMTFEEGEV